MESPVVASLGPMPRVDSQEPIPARLGHFDIVRRLGAGGMAEVFLASKPGAEGTRKLLVLKRILSAHGESRRLRSMFVEEAQLATRLNHPNIVQVYDFFEEPGGGLLLAMEHVDGPDLGKLLGAARASGLSLGPWLSSWVIAEAAKGLHYAHEKRDEADQPLDIVHRDVSPQNILLSYDGAVKIADFGIASARPFQEESGVLKGKFAYMSPEQARGEKVDRRSDIYALGAVLWEALTMQPMHAGLGGEALLDMVRSGRVDAPSSVAAEIPAAVEAIVMRALAPSREDRFQSARAMAQAIREALAAENEFIDSLALEDVIGQLVGRGPTGASPGASLPPLPSDDRFKTNAAAPAAIADEPRQREVRRVAVLSLTLVHRGESSEGSGGNARRSLEHVKQALDGLALRHRLRWTWSGLRATAIAGLELEHGDAPRHACRCAADIHELLREFRRDETANWSAAIAIVRGEAAGVRDSDDCLDKVTLREPSPAFLELFAQRAEAERTLVAGGIYRLVKREFIWDDAEAIDLRALADTSLPDAMRTYTLVRALTRDERERELALTQASLFGREVELNDLRAAFFEAAGRGQASGSVTCRSIVGEMGIGKSELVRTFVAQHPEARTIYVDVTPGKKHVPYGAIGEVVRQVCELDAATGSKGEAVDRLRATLGASGEDLPVVLADLAFPSPQALLDDDPIARRRQLVLGTRALLAALARRRTLIVVIDGAHWVDDRSLDLLGDLLRRGEHARILVLLVGRPDGRVRDVLEAFPSIALRPLARADQLRVVAGHFGVDANVEETCGDLLDRAGGNPFFLLELVDALAERGALEIVDAEAEGGDSEERRGARLVRNHDRDGDDLPSTLEQALSLRLAELPHDERSIVDWLAAAGGAILTGELELLQGGFADDAIARLCARGMVDARGDELDFRHPLLRDVANATMPPRERVDRNLRFADYRALLSNYRGVQAVAVARHYEAADAPDRAVDAYLEALAASRAVDDGVSAAEIAQSILRLTRAQDERRAFAHEALETEARVRGRVTERERHLRMVRQFAARSGKASLAVVALLRMGRFEQDQGNLADALSLAERAVSLARRIKLEDRLVEALALLIECRREAGEAHRALQDCDEAIAACDALERKGRPPIRLRAAISRLQGVLLRRVGRVEDAQRTYAEAIAVFRRVGAVRLECRSLMSLSYALYVQGRYEDAIALTIEALQKLRRIDSKIHVAVGLSTIGACYAGLGDAERALAYLRHAERYHERFLDYDSYGETRILTALIHVDSGDLLEGEAHLAGTEAFIAVKPNAYDLVHALLARAYVSLKSGDYVRAQRTAVEASRFAQAQSLLSFQLFSLALQAEAAMRLGSPHEAYHLVTMALGPVEAVQGCEYGLLIRSTCTGILTELRSPTAEATLKRSMQFAHGVAARIRNPRLRARFLRRDVVQSLLGSADRLLAAHQGGPALRA
jgi:serine/threonine protein kinase/tetratricopeptide (TPR) repeat protein